MKPTIGMRRASGKPKLELENYDCYYDDHCYFCHNFYSDSYHPMLFFLLMVSRVQCYVDFALRRAKSLVVFCGDKNTLLESYRDNGKENGNHYIVYWDCIGIMENRRTVGKP